MAEPWRHFGSFETFHPRIIQISPTPNAAAANPAARNWADGISKTDAIIRFMPSGKRAYNMPSIATANAMAVASSLIIPPPASSYGRTTGAGTELKNWNSSDSGLSTIEVPGLTEFPNASMER